jgi:hypothetical protein
MDNKSILIKCSNIEFSIKGISETYGEQVWEEDSDHEDGGWFNYVLKRYDTPKINMHFICNIDVDLHPNDIYFDGKNSFMVLTPNRLMLLQPDVDEFSIPETIVCIGSLFCTD